MFLLTVQDMCNGRQKWTNIVNLP